MPPTHIQPHRTVPCSPFPPLPQSALPSLPCSVPPCLSPLSVSVSLSRLSFSVSFISLFLSCWGLNDGPHTSQASILSLSCIPSTLPCFPSPYLHPPSLLCPTRHIHNIHNVICLPHSESKSVKKTWKFAGSVSSFEGGAYGPSTMFRRSLAQFFLSPSVWLSEMCLSSFL